MGLLKKVQQWQHLHLLNENKFSIILLIFCISHHNTMQDVRAGSLIGRNSFSSQGRLPQPAHRWLTSRTSGRATDLLRLLIHLWSSSLNSDPGLNEGSNTQGTLGRRPLRHEKKEPHRKHIIHCRCTVGREISVGFDPTGIFCLSIAPHNFLG